MIYNTFCDCPACGNALSISRMTCSNCGAEYPVNQPLSNFDTLSDEQKEFLTQFLKSRGNIKIVGEWYGISYPTVKRRLDNLLSALGYIDESDSIKDMNLDLNSFGAIDYNSSVASEIVRAKLFKNGGTQIITLLDGKPCKIIASADGKTFTSDKLNNYNLAMKYDVFNVITDLLKKSKLYTSPKGNGHGKEDKVGLGKCTEDTVVGAVAIHYFNKSCGESTYDPTFVLAAVLEWADIAINKRGYITLKPEYISKLL